MERKNTSRKARPPPGTPVGETIQQETYDATIGRDTREALREIDQDAIPRTAGVAVKA